MGGVRSDDLVDGKRLRVESRLGIRYACASTKDLLIARCQWPLSFFPPLRYVRLSSGFPVRPSVPLWPRSVRFASSPGFSLLHSETQRNKHARKRNACSVGRNRRTGLTAEGPGKRQHLRNELRPRARPYWYCANGVGVSCNSVAGLGGRTEVEAEDARRQVEKERRRRKVDISA